MCGICGKLDFHGEVISRDLLEKMTGTFPYRGPDDEGFFISHPIGMGHRRLSIIDLSPSGHQPMSNEDSSLWLIFNGEIYDFQQLRKKLQERGHSFKSRTDCETVLHLYEDEGINLLHNLNGMFALALWDKRNEHLFLARDRLGIKPLHYYWDGRTLIYASEIKAILCDPGVSKQIDLEALDLYLTLNYIPSPRTIFKNIYKLQPGHYLLAEKDGITLKSYWDIPLPPASQVSGPVSDTDQENRKKHLYTLLEDAVKRRLIADVPLGAFLSGGIDSSIIVALMSRNSTKPVNTFSIGYKQLPSFDETGYAREVAKFNHTDHHEFKLGYQDILDAFPQVLDNLDEPFADSSAVPTFIVSRETRGNVKVALSGDGGDELFAGYRMYQGEYWHRYYSLIPVLIRNSLIAPFFRSLPDARGKPGQELIRRINKFIKGTGDSFPERFYGLREIFPFSMRCELLKEVPEANLCLEEIRRMVKQEQNRFDGDPINLMLYLDLKGLLPGDMLTKVDRMSMANSLEVRVPLLDHTFVEYVFTIEGNAKLKGKTGKHIFIETFKHLLPRLLHKRPKWGFEMPIGAWLKNELKFLIKEYLNKNTIDRQGLFHSRVIDNLIKNHMSNRHDTSWHLWNLIVFQYWYEKYL